MLELANIILTIILVLILCSISVCLVFSSPLILLAIPSLIFFTFLWIFIKIYKHLKTVSFNKKSKNLYI